MSFLIGILDDCGNRESNFFESVIGDVAQTTNESSAV